MQAKNRSWWIKQAHKPKSWVYIVTLVVFLVAVIARLPFMSHGMDQWDVVLYKNSLTDMSFYREAQWPLLLLFQKGLWLILRGLSAQEILSLTNIILGAATLALFFHTARLVSQSYMLSFLFAAILFFMPLFAIYSIVGMQDIPQAFAVTAFVAAIMQFCFSQYLKWLYAASAIAGLALGVRPTLILIAPSLILAVVLVIGLKNYKIYVRSAIAFVLGACLGLAGNLLISPLKNADPKGFFLSQFHSFNPDVLGYWVKAGDYSLLSGYKLTIFYWLPVLWFLAYLIARQQRDRLKSGPIIALLASLVSLAVAYGLHGILKAPPESPVYLLEIIILGLCIIYESIRLGLNIIKGSYFKRIGERERATLVLSCLIISFIIFNYICAAPVARYLLTITPSILLLALLLIGRQGWKSWAFILLILGFTYWACPFGQSQAFAGTFKELDPRSAVARYIDTHEGKFYDFGNSADTHLQSYGVASRTQLPFGKGCSSVDANQANYAFFYGKADLTLVQSCPNFSFMEVARFQRNEQVIEDSLGNVGYTIYQILPKKN